MNILRRATDRGHFDHGWLNTFHTFSFAGYHDPAHMGFRALRVLNEDLIAPGQGFGKHPHRDMEILTYILDGQLEHADSMGHGSVIRAGQWQRMTAGSGVFHGEFNPSPSQPVHLYQIWIRPDRYGLAPEYDQGTFPVPEGQLRLIASPNGGDEAMTIHQDVKLYQGRFSPDQEVIHELAPGRHAWLQILKGEVTGQGQSLRAGDGLAIGGERTVGIRADRAAEILLFDLA